VIVCNKIDMTAQLPKAALCSLLQKPAFFNLIKPYFPVN
jgi:hypothetical protein